MKFDRTVIDGHIHFYSWFDENGKTLIEALDDYQESHGFKALNICSIPYIYADVTNNIMSAFYKLHNPTAYAYGGFVYPTKPVCLPFPEGMDVSTQYDELMELGFDGIKMVEGKPYEQKILGLKIDDELYEEFYAKAERDGTNIISHIADPDTFWDKDRAPEWIFRDGYFYGDGTYASSEEFYRQAYAVLKRHPELNVTFAHFFFMAEHPEILEELFDKYPNVTIDLVPGSEMYGGIHQRRAYYQAFFARYADRILYGTDITFPIEPENWAHLATEVYNAVTTDKMIEIYSVNCQGLKLSDEAAQKILHDNFTRCCHAKPKPINTEALKRYIEKYGHLIEEERIRAFVNEYSRSL